MVWWLRYILFHVACIFTFYFVSWHIPVRALNNCMLTFMHSIHLYGVWTCACIVNKCFCCQLQHLFLKMLSRHACLKQLVESYLSYVIILPLDKYWILMSSNFSWSIFRNKENISYNSSLAGSKLKLSRRKICRMLLVKKLNILELFKLWYLVGEEFLFCFFSPSPDNIHNKVKTYNLVYSPVLHFGFLMSA